MACRIFTWEPRQRLRCQFPISFVRNQKFCYAEVWELTHTCWLRGCIHGHHGYRPWGWGRGSQGWPKSSFPNHLLGDHSTRQNVRLAVGPCLCLGGPHYCYCIPIRACGQCIHAAKGNTSLITKSLTACCIVRSIIVLLAACMPILAISALVQKTVPRDKHCGFL